MKTLAILVVLLGSIAHADPTSTPVWRVKVESYANGELIGWPKHQCNAPINAQLRDVLQKHPYVALVDGKVWAGRGDKHLVLAQAQSITDSKFEARYDVNNGAFTIIVGVRWKDATAGVHGSVPVEVSIMSSGSACRETWLGFGTRL